MKTLVFPYFNVHLKAFSHSSKEDNRCVLNSHHPRKPRRHVTLMTRITPKAQSRKSEDRYILGHRVRCVFVLPPLPIIAICFPGVRHSLNFERRCATWLRKDRDTVMIIILWNMIREKECLTNAVDVFLSPQKGNQLSPSVSLRWQHVPGRRP